MVQAAEDACRAMGRRRFTELMLEDAVHRACGGILDELDVTTMKDYMKVRERARGCSCSS